MRYDQGKTNYNADVILFPSRWRVYCFLSQRGKNVIREWLDEENVQMQQRADFQLKIALLESGGLEAVPGFITETPVARHIYKAKGKARRGWVQLRPMLCKGTEVMDREFTFLIGAVERDGALIPKKCKEQAQENRDILLADPKRRRHEGVVGKH